MVVSALWLGVLTGPAQAQLRPSASVVGEGNAPGALRQLQPGVFTGREALVRLAPGTDPGALPVDGYDLLSEAWGLVRVWDAGVDGPALALRLKRVPGVLDAAPDLYIERRLANVPLPPDDPRYGGQWYLDTLAMEDAWAVEQGREEVSVVIVDNGCDLDHPDLEFAGGRDVAGVDDDPSHVPGERGNEHGTACAGIVGATMGNGEGIAGICPGCSLHCVRLLVGEGDRVPISADINAFEYAREIGAAVVSNSWGFRTAIPAPPMLADVIERLHTEGRDGLGTLVVFAAGNDSRELDDDELTGLEGVVAVGATTLFDDAAPFGNFGDSLDLVAPTGTLTTDVAGADGENATDYTSLFGGTSSACPVVSGVAGLLFSADATLTAAEAGALLIDSASPVFFATPDESGHDPVYGHGLVDPVAALRELVPERFPVTEPGLDGPPDAGMSDLDAGTPPDAGGGCSAAASTTAGLWGPASIATIWMTMTAPSRRRRKRRRETC